MEITGKITSYADAIKDLTAAKVILS